MKIVELTCKKCGGVMEVKEDEEKIVCPFCGTTNWIVDNDDVRRDRAKYNYLTEKEKVQAESDLNRDKALYKFLKFKYIFIAAVIVAAIIFLIIVIGNVTNDPRIAAPASSSKLIGKQYDAVANMFIDAGFENVETNAIADLQSAFLYDAKQDGGKVTSVSIGGKDKFVVDEGFIFHHTDKFDKDEQVRITYRTIPEPTRSPEDIAADEAVNADWTDMPVITSAHETGKDQFTITWEGKAPVYIVKIDGVEKTTVADNKATFKLEDGLHTAQIIPINRETRRDDIQNIFGPIKIKTSINFSLDKYHMDKDHLVAGQFSDEIKIDYSGEKIYDASPASLRAAMDLQGAVYLTFTDPYGADGYQVRYKTGNEENGVNYSLSDEDTAKWITKDEDSVKIMLDSEYLQSKEFPAIQLNKDYSFSVLLQKNPTDHITAGKAENTLLVSKSTSTNLKTTPVWKDAPVITFSEQTADGEITIKWTHPAAELGSQYTVTLRNKALIITTGESELAKVTGTEAVIKNLQNGSYTMVVTPENEGEKGNSSAEFTVNVNNNWSQTPEVTVTQIDPKAAKVEISHVFGIEKYNIKVFCGNKENLLSIIDMDYSLYGEYVVDAVSPVTEYTFVYDKEDQSTDELKVKFEIYGIHLSEDGKEQNSATKIEQITLKKE